LFPFLFDRRLKWSKNAHIILKGVRFGKTFAKWDNYDENLLNGVITVKKVKLGGKKWNSLINKISFMSLHPAAKY
jgi:hypothetical protein